MDIADLTIPAAHNEGVEMRVRGLDGVDTDFYITLAGKYSEIWRNTERKWMREMLKRYKDGEEINEEEAKREQLADVTIGWRGLKSNDEEVEFSREQVINLYKSAPYILDQANLFVGNEVNFTNG